MKKEAILQSFRGFCVMLIITLLVNCNNENSVSSTEIKSSSSSYCGIIQQQYYNSCINSIPKDDWCHCISINDATDKEECCYVCAYKRYNECQGAMTTPLSPYTKYPNIMPNDIP